MLRYIFLLLLIVITVIIFIVSWILSDMILKPKVIDYQKLYLREIEEGRLAEKVYQSWIKEDVLIKSRYGYHLSCQIINNETSSNQFNSGQCSSNQINMAVQTKKFAILCHGYTCAKYSSMIYADLFLRRGITVIAYDHRNHGLSGKAYTSMGYYEKYDLQTVIDWCFKTYGENIKIITHGESMGAATVLSHLKIDNRVSCTIADCSFSSLKKLLIYLMRYYYHIPKYPFLQIAGLLIKRRGGFRIEDVNPIEGVVASDIPVLFIHGLEDNYIPCSMSKEMYDAKKDKKELYLAPNARHAQACQKNRKEYEEVLTQFLDACNI